MDLLAAVDFVETFQVMATWHVPTEGPILGFAVCPATCMLAVVAQGRVHMYSFADLERLRHVYSIGRGSWHLDKALQFDASSLVPNPCAATAVAFVGAGKLAIACDDSVRFVDVVGRRELPEEIIHVRMPQVLAWNESTQMLAVGDKCDSTDDQIGVYQNLLGGRTEPLLPSDLDSRLVAVAPFRLKHPHGLAWTTDNHLLSLEADGVIRGLRYVDSMYLQETATRFLSPRENPMPKAANGFGQNCWVVATEMGVSLLDVMKGQVPIRCQTVLFVPHMHDIPGAVGVAWHPGTGLFVSTAASTIVVLGPPDVATMWRMSAIRVGWMVATFRAILDRKGCA